MYWKTVVAAIVVVLPASAQFGAKPVAVVNGTAIPKSELDALLQGRPQPVLPLTASQQKQINEQLVSILVDELLIRQFLAKNAPPVESGDVDRQFAALVEALKSQGKTLADYCKESRQTEKQLKAGIEQMLRWNVYAATKLTDAALQRYFSENVDHFTKATVKCNHIVLRLASDAPAADRAESEKRLSEIRQRITTGKITFADAARSYSQCPSGSSGGDLGHIRRKWMVEEPFARAAFALKVNEVSDIVVTDYGVHLIQVTERKAGETVAFDKVKDEVRELCSEEMRGRLLADLRKAAKIEINLP